MDDGQDIDADGVELQETRELERNQKESLQAEDFAISSDEDEEVEANELEAAKLNLGVCGLFIYTSSSASPRRRSTRTCPRCRLRSWASCSARRVRRWW